MAWTDDAETEKYLYHGPEALDQSPVWTVFDPTTGCSQKRPSRERKRHFTYFIFLVRVSDTGYQSEDEETITKRAHDSTSSLRSSLDTLSSRSSAEYPWKQQLHQPRSRSFGFHTPSWLKSLTKNTRNGQEDSTKTRQSGPSSEEKELAFPDFERLYQMLGNTPGPLPISNPNKLLPHSYRDRILALEKKTGTLTNEEYSFYRNFDGLWRSDVAHSDQTEQVFQMLKCTEDSRAVGEKVRNLKIRVKKSGVNVYAEVADTVVVDETRVWSGKKSEIKRRDGRNGVAEGWMERYSQGLVLRSRWSEPRAATLCEYLELTADFMHLCTWMEVSTDQGETFHARYNNKFTVFT